MRALIVKDTTVELSTRSDFHPTKDALFVLEITLDGKVMNRVKLVSRESQSGIWYADETFVLNDPEMTYLWNI